MTTLARIGGALHRLLHGPDRLDLAVTPLGPAGDLHVPSGGDGVWEVQTVQGRSCLAPVESSYYLYVVIPPEVRARAREGLWVEVEYFGDRFGQFRVQYASQDHAQPYDGLYKPAEQRWVPEAQGLQKFRRALFLLPDFDPARTQNHEASFRLEFRSDLRVSGLSVFLRAPEDAASYTATAPLPDLKKLPGRFYPINYLFIEITNACNFKCTWCPDEIMDRKRGFMKKEKVFRVLDEIAQKKAWLGPIYPVKLHQMGEPFLHPDLVEIVDHAERQGVGIELNTNCGLITPENIDGLYKAGLTRLILSYQTPDPVSFKTRKAPRTLFDTYREKVRLAVERKVALGARTRLEIDIMNTKYADGYAIVSEDEQALAFLQDWVGFAQELEARYGLAPRPHDWERLRSFHFLDQDENGSRYEILDGITLVWKRCHSWGNVIATNPAAAQSGPTEAMGAAGLHPEAVAKAQDTYCPAPYDQFVIQWNGDVVSCCTDYEGRTKTANVFKESIEAVWNGVTAHQRKRDMLGGKLLDVCAKCQGINTST